MKKLFVYIFILSATVSTEVKSQNISKSDYKQEVCLLINVLDHDYEKIGAETFKKIRSIGYETIELGNYTKPFSKELTAIYGDLKFNTLACGASLWELQQTIDTVILKGLALHQKYVICYWPWLDGAENVTIEQCRKSANIMNNLAEKCNRAGMKFAFHNHGVEFKMINGKYVCDYLLEFTDSSLISLEFDIYYAIKSGIDPIKYMDTHKGRIDILHLFAIAEEKNNPVAGDGMPDFKKMIKRSKGSGVKYLVVEGNGLNDPLRYIEDSYLKLKKMIK